MATASVTHTFAPNTLIQSSQANTDFNDLVTFVNGSVMHRDASSAFTAVPSGPATDATTDNQLVRKAMLEGRSALAHLSRNNWTLPHNVGTTVGTWTTDIAQPASYFTIVATGIQAAIAGWYQVTATANLNPSPTTNAFAMSIYRAGVRIESDSVANINPVSAPPSLQACGEWTFTVGQTLTMDVFQDTGVNQQCYTRMALRFIRPL